MIIRDFLKCHTITEKYSKSKFKQNGYTARVCPQSMDGTGTTVYTVEHEHKVGGVKQYLNQHVGPKSLVAAKVNNDKAFIKNECQQFTFQQTKLNF